MGTQANYASSGSSGTATAITETSGPTTLTVGAVADGQFTKRSGSTFVGAAAPTPSAGSVTLAMMANLAANSIVGNNTGSPATPLALTTAQVNAMLGVATVTPTIVGTGQLTGGVYTVQAADSYLQVTATASVAAEIDLRAGSSGARLTITNSGGDPATAYQVTVVPNGSDTVLGATSITIDGRQSFTLAYNTATTDWEVL